MDHHRIDNTHVPYIKSAIDRVSNFNPKKLNPAPIKLRQWLIDNNMTVPQLAIRVGFNPTTIYQYLAGMPMKYPSLAQAFAIEYVTKIPAWLWLDDKTIEARVRESNTSSAIRFEKDIKRFVLKYKSLQSAEGMIRHKARILSRLFGVDWGEVKRRCWEDAKERSKEQRFDLTGPTWEEMPDEEVTD